MPVNYPAVTTEYNDYDSTCADCTDGRCTIMSRPHPRRSEYVGAVLKERERNGYHDSDFYATVWDDDNNQIRTFEYGTTRFPCNTSCAVDATDEVRAQVAQWAYVQGLRTYTQWIVEDAREAAGRPDRGKRVEVFKGRKVPVGTVGDVFWYGDGRWGYRVGINGDDGETYWTAASNVRVVDPDQYLPSDDEVYEAAVGKANNAAFSWLTAAQRQAIYNENTIKTLAALREAV